MTTQIIPKSWLSWDYTVLDDSRPVAHIALNQWRDNGELTAGDTTYRVYRVAPLSRAFVLEGADGVLARAEKPSVFRHTLIVRHAGREYTLRHRSMFRKPFVLLCGSKELGSLVPKGIFAREAVVDLPSDLALPLRLFIVWLTVMAWRQDAVAVGGC
jgi:hypothetical protein